MTAGAPTPGRRDACPTEPPRPARPTRAARRAAWWKGERGEWLVVAQLVVMALVFLGPRQLPGQPEWNAPWPAGRFTIGCLLLLAGSVVMLASILRLGTAVTPLPYPKEQAPLVQTGPYAIVRHPIYAGGLVASIGIALLVTGWLTWLYVAVLFLLIDVKSRHEERWLIERFPDYTAYRRRVRKLLPFIY